MNRDLADERRDYVKTTLMEADIRGKVPQDLFKAWLDEALAAGIRDATAMNLATVDAQGWPDARIVLLKGIKPGGLEFFTNYNSAKVQHLDRSPHVACAVFYWSLFDRQVRVRGPVTRLDVEASDAYFRNRPRDSQLGALASNQSSALMSRAELESRLDELKQQYPEGTVIPRPAHWGGLVLRPETFEFWQGRASRLHDRFLVSRGEKDRWDWVRLAP